MASPNPSSLKPTLRFTLIRIWSAARLRVGPWIFEGQHHEVTEIHSFISRDGRGGIDPASELRETALLHTIA